MRMAEIELDLLQQQIQHEDVARDLHDVLLFAVLVAIATELYRVVLGAVEVKLVAALRNLVRRLENAVETLRKT